MVLGSLGVRVPGSQLETCFLGHFQVGSYRYRSLIEGLYTYRSLMKALNPLNSPPVVSFNVWGLGFLGFSLIRGLRFRV